ncbi:hypothetical protein WJX84_007963 [Apatococcus fuscideae]|uniref:Uncharacterized protein n=1 Tax=Apatococcus fuscideae TaxID=2026836 RepID=A0AAW1T3V1_9CHLO
MAQLQAGAQAKKLQQHQNFTRKSLTKQERLLDLLKQKAGMVKSLQTELQASQTIHKEQSQHLNDTKDALAQSQQDVARKEQLVQGLQDRVARELSGNSALLTQLQVPQLPAQACASMW